MARFTLANFLKFTQDLPVATIGEAVASGGLNIALDEQAAVGIFNAIWQDFVAGNGSATPPTSAAAAPATANAISEHVANAE